MSTDAASVARATFAKRHGGDGGRIRRDALRREAGSGDGANAAKQLAAVERGMLGYAMLDQEDEDLVSKGRDHRDRHSLCVDADGAGSVALALKAFARLV